jgi:apolipoprotein N-acyltransferase
MGSGITWLYVSIAQFGDIGWLLPLVITSAFVLLIALFYGLLGWLAGQFKSSDRLRLIAVYPALWVLVEWLRGWVFTGFPWLELGSSQIDTPLAGYGPVLGALGMSWMVALSAGLMAAIAIYRQGRVVFALSLLAIWLSGWGLLQLQWTKAEGEPLTVALIQGNIPQHKKWELEQLLPTLTLYGSKTRQQLGKDLIIWPETAVSAFQFQVDEPFLQPLEAALQKHGSNLVFGVVRLDEDGERYYNAMISMGSGRDSYFKRHLVPFTEYLPLDFIFKPLVDLFTIPMSDFTAGGKPKPLMRVGPHQVGMSICYEDAFGVEMIQALPEAAYLINASNDAWFGDSLAPHQHLQIARMRALETGRWLLRSTNTGISAIVGPKGDMVAKTRLMEVEVLEGSVQPMIGITPYGRFGNLVVLGLLLFSLMIAFPCAHRKSC